MCIIDIKILDKRLSASSLKYYTEGSCGLDLKAMVSKKIKICSNQVILLPSGIAVFIKNPLITAMIVPRSGLGHHHGIILGNTIGIIDADYQGQLMISIWNRGLKDFYIYPGDRIAQLIFVPIVKPIFNIVSDFIPTIRNTNGFGHSGI
ncbi:dUTP diphosphatase [Buchnera aphidicola]|uniref:dUTP diphosphatase n=1 Tax=Buchnera aphidicola (Sarucallis kahawaluokalani) TaxID=1241878 RepID=A0A4D6Y9T3_9GAMM|nr:dUTP diphosphatase [Buchnera aphidicola]QCI26159.1 dUTP diphosphatase [Buchnera aphidicola (Sarucallis kahawaluokalani)]